MAKKSSKAKSSTVLSSPQAPTAGSGAGQWLGKSQFHVLLILLVALAGYANSFSVPFVLDDITSIIENGAIRDMGSFLSGGGLAYNPRRFVGYLSFALNYRLGGLDPAGYHVANLAVHVACGWLVYVLCRATFDTPFFRRAPLSPSAKAGIPLLAALLFVAHPVQTQAVTYVVQRLASLATLFYLAALLSFAKGRLLQEEQGVPFTAKSVAMFLLALVFSVAALTTKEIAATLPLALLLYDFSFFGKGLRKRYLVLAASALCIAALGVAALNAERPIGELISDIGRATRETQELSRPEYLLTQFSVIVTYLRLLVLPVRQNLDYDFPIYHSFFTPPVFLSFLVLALLFALALYLYLAPGRSEPETGEASRQRVNVGCYRLIGFGILWFFLTLSVESSLIPISDVIFEHRLYLPCFGAFLALASAFFLAFGATTPTTRTVLAATLIAVLTVTTYQRNGVWGDRVTLWSDNAAKSPGKWRPYNNLARALLLEGRLNEALAAASTAVQLGPDSYESHNNLGTVYEKLGSLDQAIEHYRLALAGNPAYVTALGNLGAALDKKGAVAEAVGYYRKAVELDGTSMVARNNLGGALLKQGDLGQAMLHLREAVRLEPSAVEPRTNLASALESAGEVDQAIAIYRDVLAQKPDYALGHHNLGLAYYHKKEMEQAIRCYEEALRLDPGFSKAYISMGRAYASLKQVDKALVQFQQARRVSPQDQEAIVLEARTLQYLQSVGR